MSFFTRMAAGIRAFREAYMSADLQPGTDQQLWNDPDGRALRYAVLWSYYENTAYRNVHKWATKMRADYGLYAHTRSLYSPAHRLAEFWVSHLLGGALDPHADVKGAIPIELGEGVKIRQGEALRGAIAQLWRDSRWQTNKAIWTRTGTVLGDVGLKVVDDVLRGKVYLDIIHPATIRHAALDPFGHVKAYCLEEQRPDPRPTYQRGRDARPDGMVTYREDATREGDLVVYQTYLNSAPYAWNGVASEWDEPYGFIPFVLTKHIDVGLDWGWSELHAGLSKIREVDDLASKLDDQIRKTVDPPWLLAGVKKPEATPKPSRTGTSGDENPTTTNREDGRQEIPILYASDPQAKPHPMVAPLDIAGVLDQIAGLAKDLERDYPELALDIIQTTAGDASGRALHVAREPVENKAVERRAPYDADVVRAQQMAIAIGGHRGYAGYEGFSLDSYAAGQLDHRVAERPVFGRTKADELTEQQLFWTVAGLAEERGMPIELYLQDAGWDHERIAKVLAEQAKRQQQAAELARQTQQNAGQGPGDGAQGGA